MNDAITNVLAYYNYFRNLTEYTAECNALRTMMIVTVPAYVNYSRTGQGAQQAAPKLRRILQEYVLPQG